MKAGFALTDRSDSISSENGFTLMEFIISAAIFLVLTSGAFMTLAEIQQTAGFHSEIQAVLNNTRIAKETVERHLRHAGNDPMNIGLSGITLVASDSVHIKSDLKGSLGTAAPNRGDPDGDIHDHDENIILRFNEASHSIIIVPASGPPRIIANYISSFAAELRDAENNPTVSLDDARTIAVSITGSSRTNDPRTGKAFSFTLSSVISLFS
ncbi:MAG TPA: prepilin-type N-terminal cleavage/methylation domain-containing protein [Acidobacteriota bacterium]|nr:prepilin-type N-terminal cleavage/methylation domain-containing protein [Acidobacteriota bacterium]